MGVEGDSAVEEVVLNSSATEAAEQRAKTTEGQRASFCLFKSATLTGCLLLPRVERKLFNQNLNCVFFKIELLKIRNYSQI